jgi:hypothetical protein
MKQRGKKIKTYISYTEMVTVTVELTDLEEPWKRLQQGSWHVWDGQEWQVWQNLNLHMELLSLLVTHLLMYKEGRLSYMGDW